jgi:hypothetical protein
VLFRSLKNISKNNNKKLYLLDNNTSYLNSSNSKIDTNLKKNLENKYHNKNVEKTRN